jgi:hypothetical protein
MAAEAARVRLNWSAPGHWSDEMAPCRCCGTATHGRDEQRRPCHQSCAEAELAAEILGALGSAVLDERYFAPTTREVRR